MSGHPEFDRAFRVHANTVEQLVLFLPLLWLSTAVIGDLWAGVAGAVWIVGRVLYAGAYMREPTARGPGMIVTLLPTAVLAIAALVGVIRAFL